MAADVRSNVRKLHLVDGIVPVYHVVKPVFPVHRHKRQAIVIQEQESTVPIHGLFKLDYVVILF